MIRHWQGLSLMAFVSTLAGTVWGQPEPVQPAPVEPPGTMPPPSPETSPTVPVPEATSPPPPAGEYSMAPPPPAPTYYDQPPPAKRQYSDVGRLMFGATWNLGIPIGSVHDFTSNVSALGFDLRFRYWLHERVSLGINADWQTLVDDKDRETQQISNGAVTARLHNSAQIGAIRAAGEFYFTSPDVLARPFIGANVGFGWVNFQTVASDLSKFDTKDSVVLGGELGSLFTFSHQAPRLLVAGRYSFQPSADFLNVTNVQTISIMVGIASP